ncbi:MAG TPA: DinB family protein [Gemmatimonadaceae bacterium]|nr:DinB family protein [Gemmatimonadaceae bacterium]
MPQPRIARPDENEYAPSFHGYIFRVPDGNLIELLDEQVAATRAMLGSLSDSDARFRYGPDKWSIKEVVGHVTDTERIMAYRALCFARGEKTVLPSFEENDYVKAARFDERELSALLAEFGLVRAATVALFDGLSEDELMRRGRTPSGEYSVRAMAYNIAGHELHHQQILTERYLAALHTGAAAGAR